MSEYVGKVMEAVKAKDPAQPEFHQAVHEVAESVQIVYDKQQELFFPPGLNRLDNFQLVFKNDKPFLDFRYPVGLCLVC